MTRTILHLDLDAFFCAVEEQHDPNLRGKAFAVGGRPDQRGVIASCSYPARQFGVRSAMPSSRALRMCPGLRILPARHGVYGKVSQQVMAILSQATSQVEQISIDEAFLDISQVNAPLQKFAKQLQEQIFNELHLPCSIGIASNKLVAKIANDIGKSRTQGSGPPMAITIVPPGEEATFLAPFAVETLWGVGPKTAERLQQVGVLTIGDLAQKSLPDLTHLFGKNGVELFQHARGIDERPLITFHEVKSVSHETTFSKDISDRQKLLKTIQELSRGVSLRLKEANRLGTTVKIKLRWPDFTSQTRQNSFSQPIQESDQIYKAALLIFDQVWSEGKAVRLIGVGVSGLRPSERQLSLFNQTDPGELEKQRLLQEAIDELKKRYGNQVIHPARDLSKTDQN